MNQSFTQQRDDGLRLITALKHATILAETDDFLEENGVYKLISFYYPGTEAPYDTLEEDLFTLTRDRYESISGHVSRRFMLLFRLQERFFRADSVWIDSVASELARRYGVIYNSSMPVRGLFALRGAHQQVIEEEEFNYFANHKQHREENSDSEALGDYFSERQLFDSLARRFELAALAGKQERISSLRDEALDKAVYLRPYSIEEVHRRIEMFIHALLNRLDRDGALESRSELRRRVLNRLLFCDTERELRERAEALSEQLLLTLRGTQPSSAVAAEHIRAYIDENLGDVNLCVTSVAEAFERKSRAVNGLFSERYGTSIFRYIQAQRLALAGRLLKESTLDVVRVCEKAGYGSINTMIRAFRQAYGLSPSEYRHQHRKAEKS